jgi:DNA-binding XRE family transcriptional regulator
MTNRERDYAALGIEYAEGIERADRVTVPSTGREVRRTKRGTWEAQPWNDNYWQEFNSLLDALRFATKPQPFAVTLARLRESAGLTLQDLGDAAGLSRQRVHQLETGAVKPTWAVVQALATALDVSTEVFRDPES